MPICGVCKKKVKYVMTLKVTGREETKPICDKCFNQAAKRRLEELKKEIEGKKEK